MTRPDPHTAVELSAVIVSVSGNTPHVMTTTGRALPSGAFGTDHPTLEQGLRAWVEAQSGIGLGYVEQLYTFADRNRTGQGQRIISIGYLALTRATPDGSAGMNWYAFFPWEDRREGVPAVTDAIRRALTTWKNAAPDAATRRAREGRIAIHFPDDPRAWNDELVLQRYELLWEAELHADLEVIGQRVIQIAVAIGAGGFVAREVPGAVKSGPGGAGRWIVRAKQDMGRRGH